MLSLLSSLEEGGEDDDDEDWDSRLQKFLFIFHAMEDIQACKLAVMLGTFIHVLPKQALKLVVIIGDTQFTFGVLVSSKLFIYLKLVQSFLHEMEGYVHIIHLVTKDGQILLMKAPHGKEGAKGHHCLSMALMEDGDGYDDENGEDNEVYYQEKQKVNSFSQARVIFIKVFKHALGEEDLQLSCNTLVQGKEELENVVSMELKQLFEVAKFLVRAGKDSLQPGNDKYCALSITDDSLLFTFSGIEDVSSLFMFRMQLCCSCFLILFAVGKDDATLFASASALDFFFLDYCLQAPKFLHAWRCSNMKDYGEGEISFLSFISPITGHPGFTCSKDELDVHSLGHDPEDQASKREGPAVLAVWTDIDNQDTHHVSQNFFEFAVERELCTFPFIVHHISDKDLFKECPPDIYSTRVSRKREEDSWCSFAAGFKEKDHPLYVSFIGRKYSSLDGFKHGPLVHGKLMRKSPSLDLIKHGTLLHACMLKKAASFLMLHKAFTLPKIHVIQTSVKSLLQACFSSMFSQGPTVKDISTWGPFKRPTVHVFLQCFLEVFILIPPGQTSPEMGAGMTFMVAQGLTNALRKTLVRRRRMHMIKGGLDFRCSHQRLDNTRRAWAMWTFGQLLKGRKKYNMLFTSPNYHQLFRPLIKVYLK